MADIWIKICGITRAGDASAAIALGANAIGVVCYPPSGRHVPSGRISEILGGIDREVEVFALFVNPAPEDVREVIDSGLFSGLQFHGEESAAFCESFGLPYMKALRVRGDEDLRPVADSFASADRILLDTWDSAGYGGTGKTFRWDVAARLVASGRDNIVIAGGLDAGNVARAIREVGVGLFGVDVSSGVEARTGMRTGIKSISKVADFIKEARNART